MRSPALLAIPVVVPRAFVLWVLLRLAFAAVVLFAGEELSAMVASPGGMALICGIVGAVDVRVRGERILWANLGVGPILLCAIYGTAAIPGELLLSLVLP